MFLDNKLYSFSDILQLIKKGLQFVALVRTTNEKNSKREEQEVMEKRTGQHDRPHPHCIGKGTALAAESRSKITSVGITIDSDISVGDSGGSVTASANGSNYDVN